MEKGKIDEAKTRGRMRRREEKGYHNDIVQELMIEDTPGYRDIMRMTHDDFLEILMLVDPCCNRFRCHPFPLFSFTTGSVFLRFQSPQFQQRSLKLLLRSRSLKDWTNDVCKQEVVSMDTEASVVRMRAPNMFDTAVQTNKTSPIKHEKKRNVLSC